MKSKRNCRVALLIFAAALLGACGASARSDGDAGGDDDDDVPDASIFQGADAGPEAIVYAHDDSTLFALNPVTFEVRTIGPMTGCFGVVDLAVNAQNQIFGSGATMDGQNGIIAIDPVTAACHLQVAGDFSNALSFVPKGVLSPDKEMLVSYGTADGVYQYVSIDPDTGEVRGIGDIPQGYGSSGDIVSVEGGGTYWSAYGPCNDCLVELDPATGALIKDWGAIGYGGIWGLAFWGGFVYGFSSEGQIVKITFGTDSISSELVVDTDHSFYGAGSSTHAPLVIE